MEDQGISSGEPESRDGSDYIHGDEVEVLRREDVITVNALPGSYTGVVAYNWMTGKISVADDGKNLNWAMYAAVRGLV